MLEIGLENTTEIVQEGAVPLDQPPHSPRFPEGATGPTAHSTKKFWCQPWLLSHHPPLQLFSMMSAYSEGLLQHMSCLLSSGVQYTV